MKIAVIGSGISGLSAAFYLSKRFKVDLNNRENQYIMIELFLHILNQFYLIRKNLNDIKFYEDQTFLCKNLLIFGSFI